MKFTSNTISIPWLPEVELSHIDRLIFLYWLLVVYACLFLHETQEEKHKRKQVALAAIDGGSQLVPSAMTVAGALGTENGTWFAFGGHRRSWLNDSIRYVGGGGLRVANLDLYKKLSFGPIDKEIKFGTKTSVAVLAQKVQFRIADTPLMLGVKQMLAKSKVESDSKLIDKVMQLTLGSEAVTSGLGVLAEYDTRDNLFYPSKGYKVAADYMIYDEALGSDYNYRTFNLEAEVYIPIVEKLTLGFCWQLSTFRTERFYGVTDCKAVRCTAGCFFIPLPR